MAQQVPWNKEILEEFIRIAELSPEEEWIMRTRVTGTPISKQAMKLNKSPASVSRMIARLKVKYDRARAYSDKLPERKFSAKETWMDTH